MKRKLGVTKADDGEFYMHFRDFLRYFSFFFNDTIWEIGI